MTENNTDEESSNYSIIKDLKHLLDTEDLKEIGTHAIWSVSSCKQGKSASTIGKSNIKRPEGFGVNLLRDNNLESYWQSDGVQPHMVNVQFRQKTSVHSVGIYTDYKADESYTPSKLSVRIGNDFNDLREIEQVEVNEPHGWVWIKLCDRNKEKAIRTFMVQVSVMQNHQNGRDTHMRQIKVFASSKDNATFDEFIRGSKLPNFTSVDMSQYSVIK